MTWRNLFRIAQAPADAAGGSAGAATETTKAQGADSGSSVTPPAGAAGAADSKQDGGSVERKSMLGEAGADQGDTSKDGKDTTKEQEKDAGGDKTPTPVKIQLPEKLPDGVAVDAALVARAEKLFGERGLDNEDAKSIFGLYLDIEGERVTAAARAMDQWSREQYESLEKDPEYGGKNLAESKAAVQRALSQFGKKFGLSQRLEALGLDNDPAIIKTLAAVGRAIGEDKSPELSSGGQVLSERERRDAVMFPSHAALAKRLGQTGT